MKLSFSTLGCHEWEIDQIIEAAMTNGYDGVELRHYNNSLDLPKVISEFPGGASNFRRQFARAGIEICCVDTSVVLSESGSSVTDSSSRSLRQSHVHT